MNPEAFDNFYFIGIGGIGMSALARYFAFKGKRISGYDKTPSPITDAVQKEGISINFEDTINVINESFLNDPENTLIIYTPAIPGDHQQLAFFRENGFTVKKRSEILGQLSANKFTIAVGGAHGKTSTAAFIAHLMKVAQIDFFGFLGGISTNYETNFLAPGKEKDADILLAEADEYDRSFLQLTPDITVLTSSDPDHLDIYGTHQELLAAYQEFARQTKSGGLLVHKEDMDLDAKENAYEKISFGIEKGDWQASNIQIEDHQFVFDLNFDGQKTRLKSGVPGEHNILNITAGCAALKNLISNEEFYRQAADTFKGVKRRFEYILDTEDVVFVDDYAHHPSELDFTIKTLKGLYPEEKITGIFQPHLYSRTRDFTEGFAEVLSQLDKVILLPIYPAREEPIEGVSSGLIFNMMDHPDKHLLEKSELNDFMTNDRNKVIATLGAGDIDRLVQPLKETLENVRGK